jgi:threonine dehydrogenase-like Zn-dependent dehydrogenase
MPFVTFPRIPGHEISGLIVKKGNKVSSAYKVGDAATVSPYTQCGTCPSCRQGRFNCCEFNQTLGVQRDGALTRFISVPAEKVYVSSKLSHLELALIEPFSVGYHATNRGKVCETDIVLMLGCGTIGMGALAASVRKGATVIALDIDDNKLQLAKKFGASFSINPSKENAKEVLMKITNNEGANIAIEAAGTPVTFNLALELVSFGGRVVSIGYSKEETPIKTQLIVSKELDICGSRNALRVFPSVIKMFELRERSYTDMITKVFPFKETPEAFRFWNENPGKVSKIIIDIQNQLS